MIRYRKFLLSTILPVFWLGLSGCGQNPAPSPNSVSARKPHHHSAERPVTAAGHEQEEHRHAAHDHSGWWCDEHGVPEEICGLCNAKIAAEFQRKKDWCKEHDRPASQCFACHPELESRFAAQFEAKYGKKPPKPSLN